MASASAAANPPLVNAVASASALAKPPLVKAAASALAPATTAEWLSRYVDTDMWIRVILTAIISMKHQRDVVDQADPWLVQNTATQGRLAISAAFRVVAAAGAPLWRIGIA